MLVKVAESDIIKVSTKRRCIHMTEKEMLKISVEEFSRVQDWMEIAEKDSDIYKSLKKRYIDLKVILTSSGVNLTEIDRIKE